MNRKRVCCFCEKWASGGIESFLFNVISHMDLTRFDIDIVTSKQMDSIFTAPLESLGVQFFQLSGSPYRMRENRRMFRAILAQRQYDVVHLNIFNGASLCYAKLAKDAGVCVRIGHSHCAQVRSGKTKAVKLLVHQVSKWLYLNALTDRWACSQPAGAFLFSGSFQIIPNGIDLQRFRFQEASRARIRAAYGLDGCMVVGHIGRLCSEKNQRFLLEVMKALAVMAPHARLLLVGDGEEREALQAHAQALGIAQNVIFAGSTNEPEAFYCAMDIFAFPSFFEGMPFAALEAQCAGLQVLCSDTLSCEVFVTPRMHALPLADGAEAWAKAIVGLCAQACSRSDVSLAVKKAGYDVADAAAMIEQVYGRADG